MRLVITPTLKTFSALSESGHKNALKAITRRDVSAPKGITALTAENPWKVISKFLVCMCFMRVSLMYGVWKYTETRPTSDYIEVARVDLIIFRGASQSRRVSRFAHGGNHAGFVPRLSQNLRR